MIRQEIMIFPSISNPFYSNLCAYDHDQVRNISALDVKDDSSPTDNTYSIPQREACSPIKYCGSFRIFDLYTYLINAMYFFVLNCKQLIEQQINFVNNRCNRILDTINTSIESINEHMSRLSTSELNTYYSRVSIQYHH